MPDPLRSSDRWQFWIDRGGTFTDVVGKRPDGTLVTLQAAVRKPRAIPRRSGGRHPPPARLEEKRADHARAGRVREDGHDGRDQRAARTQGRADAAGHDTRLSRCAAHRVPGAAAHLRPAHRAARAAVLARDRGARACRRRRRGRRAARRAPPARARCRPRSTPACEAARSSSCTATATPRTRRPHNASPARSASRRSARRITSAR